MYRGKIDKKKIIFILYLLKTSSVDDSFYWVFFFVCLERVVVTSSCAAVQTQDSMRNPEKFFGKIFGENDWNKESTLEEGAYRMSKNLAEQAAWEFQEKIEVVTVCPSFILGPPLSKR